MRRCVYAFFMFLFTNFLIILSSYTYSPEAKDYDQTAVAPSVSPPILTTQTFPAYPVKTGSFHTTVQVQRSPYWTEIQELLESYLPEDFAGEAYITACNTWLRVEPERRTKFFNVNLRLNDSAAQSSNTTSRYLFVNKHCSEKRGYFDFNIWVEEENGQDVLKTDFPQQLFAYLIAECANTFSTTNGDYIDDDLIIYLAAFSPSYSASTVPYFELWEEPLVLQGSSYDSQSQAVFHDAYTKMHNWQNQITGDLSQDIRFCYDFLPEEEEVSLVPEKLVSDMNVLERADWEAAVNIQGYQTWLDSHAAYFPAHTVSFSEPYGPEQDELFTVSLAETEAYHSGSNIDMAETLEESVENESITVVVASGDTLWSLAQTYYGDGNYWQKIWEDNRDVIGNNKNLIMPGMNLQLNPA